jgi:prepilin-type N-terminal cleavage/methylation domain-containing protein
MKTISTTSPNQPRGFTLIEMLVVISIIGILAGLILPALVNAKTKVKKMAAKTEMNGLIGAIKQYEGTYNRLPASGGGTADVTFGFTGSVNGIGGTSLGSDNSEIMVVIMDIPTGTNANHQKNPQQHKFFAPGKMATDTTSPGVSTADYQFRDPWGNPYVISLDLTYDERTRDAIYGGGVGAGAGLINVGGGIYEWSGDVMVWSFGPDKKASKDDAANEGDNKDNVLSWK